MRNTVLHVFLAASALSACAPGDPTTLASGLTDPNSLTVNDGTIFWINSARHSDSSIQSVAATGGKVTTVLSQANLDGNLATDGTSLYFSFPAANGSTSVISSCGLDGSNVQQLTSAVQVETPSKLVSVLFAQGGTVYVAATVPPPGICVFNCGTPFPVLSEGPFIWSLPSSGGTPVIAVPMPVTATHVELLGTLYRVDSSGIYYSSTSGDIPTGNQKIEIHSIALSGGSPATLWSVSETGPMPYPPGGGGLTVAGDSAFWLADNFQTSDVELLSAPTAGGSPSTIQTYHNQMSTYLAGDSNGLFIDQEIQSNDPGIFSVSLSGTATSYVQSAHAFSTSVGSERQMVVDSTNVYWVAGGHNGGQATVHAKAR
ncbi:MAG: hypothetical protein ACYDCL_11345 [Myxococcales bacterium]